MDHLKCGPKHSIRGGFLMKNYILVIDEGTTGTRAILFDRDFRIVGKSYAEITQYTPSEDKVEHDPVEIFDKSLEMCKKVIADTGVNPEEIACIGITNQRNTCLLWDKETGEPLYNAIVWQDTRTAEACSKIKESPKIFQRILDSTGKIIAPHCSATILDWLLKNVPGAKELVDSGRALFGTIDSWLVWKLTEGKTHAVSYSNASSMGCIDLSTGSWNKELFDYIGVPISVFPEIRSESSGYGITNLLGAPIPITGVIADQQSALFAQGCHSPGSVKCTNGTGSFMDINIGNEYKVVGNGLDTLIAWKLGDEITYAIEGFAPVTGAAVQWLRDGLELIESSDESEELARQVPDTNGVYFVPALAGLASPHQDPYARGVIVGLSLGVKKAHVIRATLEAIAFSIKDIMDVVEKTTGVKIKSIKIDGGASKNNLLAQMMADYIDAQIARTVTSEATSLGAALMAGLHIGMWKLEDLSNIAQIEKTFMPNISEAERTEKYNGWLEAVNRSLKWIKY